MKIYKAYLFPDGWNEKAVIGHFTSEEKAWKACFESHPDYKMYRLGLRYEFHYKHYHVREIEVKK